MIRKATEEDAETLTFIAENSGYKWEHVITPEEHLEFMKKGDFFLVLKLEDGIKAYASLTDEITADQSKIKLDDEEEKDRFDKGAKLRLIAVLKEYHKKRFGRALISRISIEAVHRGNDKLYLFVPEKNENAIIAYDHIGFKKLGIYPNKYGLGEHAVFMGKELKWR